MCSGREGFGFASGSAKVSFEARRSASSISPGSSGFGKLTNSCGREGKLIRRRRLLFNGTFLFTYLETLCVPPLDFLDTGHLVQVVGEFIEFLHSVSETYR
jgi:hypothetical protein